MKLAGVIGWPVAHSLSPRLHRHWLDMYGISGRYVSLPVRREDFSRALAGLSQAGFAGVNITLPHKESAFSVANELDAAAIATGAVNLLLLEPSGRLRGRNTDAEGLIASIQETGLELTAGRAVVLGSGGAARAAVSAVAALGATQIRLVCRDVKRGQALISCVKDAAPTEIFAWPDWSKAAKDAAILINATSGGLAGGSKLELPLEPLPKQAVVCDLVYTPLETDLLSRARAHGNPTIDGLGMLMHQAVPSFEAFYGVRPAITPSLRGMLEDALRDGI